jgi:hypothetical protein
MVAYPLTKRLYRFAAGVVKNTRRAVQAASSSLLCPKDVRLGGDFSCYCDGAHMLVKVEKLRVANAVYFAYPSKIEFLRTCFGVIEKKGE